MHNYLYRFSLDRFESFIRDGPIIKLFNYYFENHGKTRIVNSPIIKRYREAYFEAAEMILQNKEGKPNTGPLNAEDLMSAEVLPGRETEAEPKTGDSLADPQLLLRRDAEPGPGQVHGGD